MWVQYILRRVTAHLIICCTDGESTLAPPVSRHLGRGTGRSMPSAPSIGSLPSHRNGYEVLW